MNFDELARETMRKYHKNPIVFQINNGDTMADIMKKLVALSDKGKTETEKDVMITYLLGNVMRHIRKYATARTVDEFEKVLRSWGYEEHDSSKLDSKVSNMAAGMT